MNNKLNLLFIHNNCPGQFLPMIRVLRENSAITITFISGPTPNRLHRVKQIFYKAPSGVGWSAYHERGQAVYNVIKQLLEKGVRFDAIFAHLPYGDALYVRRACPDIPFIVLPEFYLPKEKTLEKFFDNANHAYASHFASDNIGSSQSSAVVAKGVLDADAAVVPTSYQLAQFPVPLRPLIQVIHEGIEDRLFLPAVDDPEFVLPSGQILTKNEEIVTFATRALEPLRGYDAYLRAAQMIAARRPNTLFIVAGNESYSYTGRPSNYPNWRAKLEVEIPVPKNQLIFVGLLDRDRHISLLRLSAAHVYLTAPFVVSWSLLEAMALGAPIIASATDPVQEFITDGMNGKLVEFFDHGALARGIEDLLHHRLLGQEMGQRARSSVLPFTARRCVAEYMQLLASCLPDAGKALLAPSS